MTRAGFVWQRAVAGLALGAVAIAIVTVVIAVLKQLVDPIGLTGLYLFAIVPVAIVYGFWVAGIVTVPAYLAFAFFVADPLYSFSIADGDTAAAIVISIAAPTRSASSRGGRPSRRARPS